MNQAELEKARAKYEESMVDAYYEGMEKGIEIGKRIVALKMLKMGLTPETISEDIGLTVDEILKLQQNH